MIDWHKRITILARKKKRIYIKTFREQFGNGWVTTFKKLEESDIIVSPRLSSREEAEKLHEDAIRDAAALGYMVIYNELDAREKAPDAAATAQGAEE
jgi:hypothetical protein|nr:MAG TPA: hypothetical protein [Caudoviricetes sp.]